MFSPLAPGRHFLARSNEDRIKIFGVAILVAFVSAVVVSTTAVTLKPLHEAHLQAERDARMALMLDTLPGMRDIMEEAGVETLETRLVDLETGAFFADNETASDPAPSVAIPPDADVARLGTRAEHATVYLLERDGDLMLVVLPVTGAGYQSTIRAMLALEPDLQTIAALTIIEQGETPGIGSRVEDPSWQALWAGKQVADEAGQIVITVVRGQATEPFEVDGITGATVTSNGVANMLRYWLGDHGFGPFLDRLEREGL